MINYQDTKIYYIQVQGERYYGHTAQKYISSREVQHRVCFKKGAMFKVYQAMREANMTASDIKCVWVEDYPCNSFAEALARERYWIEKGGTLNMVVPTRTQKERYLDKHEETIEKKRKYVQKHAVKVAEYQKRYMEEHKQEYIEKKREYLRKHAVKIAEYRKQYAKEHKQELKKNKKDYVLRNKERLAATRAEQIPCPLCGKVVRRDSVTRHKKALHTT